MTRFRSILGVLAIFVLGVFAGAILAFVVMEAVQRKAFVEGGGKAVAEITARRVAWRLGADKSQRAQIRQILLETGQDLTALRRKVTPELREIFVRAEGKLRAVLRPEQQEEFDKLAVQLRQTWDK